MLCAVFRQPAAVSGQDLLVVASFFLERSCFCFEYGPGKQSALLSVEDML